MVIPRTFIETEIHPHRGGWQVRYHIRPRSSIFAVPKTKQFRTEQDAREWMCKIWMEGNADLKRRGKKNLTTRSVMWVRPDLVPAGPYSRLPEFRVTRTDEGLTVRLDGLIVASGCKTGRELKRQIVRHPKGVCLCVKPCARCGRLPRVDLVAGALRHLHEDCNLTVCMPPDDLTPPTMQIALWNRYFSGRYRPTVLNPMTRPHFMVLGALREPSEREMERRITRIEVI